ITKPVCVIDQCAKPPLIGWRPVPGYGLPAFFYFRPGVIPPAAIVGRLFSQQQFGSDRRSQVSPLFTALASDGRSVRGAEQAKLRPWLERAEENLFLCIGVLRQHKQRFDLER